MSTAARVLVIEDEGDLRALLSYNLEAWGYQVRAVDAGLAGLRTLDDFSPDLVLLDLMLPDLSGIEVCRKIRARQDRVRPVVIMLTARGDEIDRVAGFEVGADDYMVKPFSVRELMLRMSARLAKRSTDVRALAPAIAGDTAVSSSSTAATPAAPSSPLAARAEGRRRYVLGSLEVDPDGYHVYVLGSEVHVSALEMRLLVHLFESQGLVRTRKDLLTKVWGYQPDVTSRTVDAHVKRLRDKLGDAGRLIETVRGLGYRLADPDQRRA
jgi:two-component system phosphate regulon response regulator PhoB